MLTEFYGQIEPNPEVTPNPFATRLVISNSGSGADVVCSLYPRRDATPGSTGYVDVCVNQSSTTAETVSFTPNQSTYFDSWDTQSNINDSASGFCPSFTPLTYNDRSFHNCAIVITIAASGTFTLSGTNAMQPGAVRFFHLANGTASSAASPTPVPVITPTAGPTEVPVSFPADYPLAYEPYVNARVSPQPYVTYYPYTSGPTVNAGAPANYESFQYVNSKGEVLYVPYFPQPSATPNTFIFSVTNTQPGAGANFIGTTAFLPTPTSSPCTYGGGGLTLGPSPNPNSTGSAQAYGICVPSVVQFEASPPSPNPSPTYSAYPGMLDAPGGTNYISAVGGPFPPASRQLMFFKNPMLGIIPSSPTIDPNDADYKAHSGVNGTPAPLLVVGTIAGAPSSGYSYNWVTNGSPSVPLNETCSGTCGTMGISPVFSPADLQIQGQPDCHTEFVYFTLQYVEDLWQADKSNTPACTGPVYQGATITSVAATRLLFSGDGTHSQVTASTISPGIGMIRGQDVLDSRVATFPTGIQIAPPCTNAAWRYPAFGSDAGVGSSCNIGDGIQPPNGAEVFLNETAAHVASCGLDILSQKFWMNMVPGLGHGLFITDTNGGGSTSYYVQNETDRDMTRFGVASSWQLIAKMLNVSIGANGTYSLPISTGSGCINTADIHFLDPSTPNVQGTTIAP
jgi:hypothetical protein